jgi:phosphonate degradation associated HDIG domain protein
MKGNIDQTVDEVFALYTRYGNEDYIGEPVSQLEHMSQAVQLAQKEGFDNEVVLAAFFHDIGHICVMQNQENNMGGYGVRSHEKVGADFLRAKGFPEKVASLVELHVQAKRYLTFKYPDYYNNLSEASKKTLEFQGGVMQPEEAVTFETHPLFEISILMRKWDELAKEINIPVIDLEALKALSKKVLNANV